MLSECNQQISTRLNTLSIDVQIARFIQCFNSHVRQHEEQKCSINLVSLQNDKFLSFVIATTGFFSGFIRNIFCTVGGKNE
jgi:hypothetical protein